MSVPAVLVGGEERQGDSPDRHPVHGCPDRDSHLRALRRLRRVEEEIRSTQDRIRSRAESLSDVFDRVLQVLEEWGHLDGWALSDKGENLVRIFHECDLLIAEVMADGLLDGLDPPTMAGVVSSFIYKHRNSAPEIAEWFPSRDVADRCAAICEIGVELNRSERVHGLPLTRQPDSTFFALAHAWSSGEDLEEVLGEDEITGGDFVRTMKQLIDLLRQIADAATTPDTAHCARSAADSLFRGVVAASAPSGGTIRDQGSELQ